MRGAVGGVPQEKRLIAAGRRGRRAAPFAPLMMSTQRSSRRRLRGGAPPALRAERGFRRAARTFRRCHRERISGDFVPQTSFALDFGRLANGTAGGAPRSAFGSGLVPPTTVFVAVAEKRKTDDAEDHGCGERGRPTRPPRQWRPLPQRPAVRSGASTPLRAPSRWLTATPIRCRRISMRLRCRSAGRHHHLRTWRERHHDRHDGYAEHLVSGVSQGRQQTCGCSCSRACGWSIIQQWRKEGYPCPPFKIITLS